MSEMLCMCRRLVVSFQNCLLREICDQLSNVASIPQFANLNGIVHPRFHRVYTYLHDSLFFYMILLDVKVNCTCITNTYI